MTERRCANYPPSKRAKGRFDWEREVIGPNGPRSTTTRHVLLTLATHVARHTARAWPSIRTLESETGLSNRSVIDHLHLAVAQGWLEREFTRLDEMRYRGYACWLTIPMTAEPASPLAVTLSGEGASSVAVASSAEGASPVAATQPTGELDSATDERAAPTGERRIGELVNVLLSTSLLNRENKKLDDQRSHLACGSRTAKPCGETWQEWAEKRGMHRQPGEQSWHYQLRVLAERRKQGV
jgi:helix-turn-helix protein